MRARQPVGDKGQRNQHQRPDQRREPEQRMEQVTDCEIERDPRQVEQRGRAEPGEIAAHLVEVAHRLQPVAARARPQRPARDDIVSARRERAVEPLADADKDAPTQNVEERLEQIEAADQRGEADQRRHAVARHHAVVDFQHEERAGQVQHVQHGGDQAEPDQHAAAGAERRGQVVRVRWLVLARGRRRRAPPLPDQHNENQGRRDERAHAHGETHRVGGQFLWISEDLAAPRGGGLGEMAAPGGEAIRHRIYSAGGRCGHPGPLLSMGRCRLLSLAAVERFASRHFPVSATTACRALRSEEVGDKTEHEPVPGTRSGTSPSRNQAL